MDTTINETNLEQNDNLAYINAIQDLKDNSVDRKLYNKLREERDALISSLATGDTATTVESEQVRSLADCREAFVTRTTSQCEYMQKLLDLREAAIREGEPDPFVATGHHVQPTAYNYERAQQIADIYRECLETAEGDDRVLMSEIQRRMR